MCPHTHNSVTEQLTPALVLTFASRSRSTHGSEAVGTQSLEGGWRRKNSLIYTRCD